MKSEYVLKISFLPLKPVLGDVAITFVTPNIVGALCTEEHPYAAHGPWLQVRTKDS